MSNEKPSTKELRDISFEELVMRGIELELDAIVRGESLKSRVYAVMNLASLWAAERAAKKS